VGRTVTLKIRFADFTMLTRSRTFDHAHAVASDLANAAARLLDDVDVGSGVRLLGVHLSNLQPASKASARQLALFDDDGAPLDLEVTREGIDLAADEIRSRFGDRAIGTVAATARRSDRRHAEPTDREAVGRPGRTE
jgi:DNA polymerase-4